MGRMKWGEASSSSGLKRHSSGLRRSKPQRPGPSAVWRTFSCSSRRPSPVGESPLAVRGSLRRLVNRLLQFAEVFASWRIASCSSRKPSPFGELPLAVRRNLRQLANRLLQFAETFAVWRIASCSSQKPSPFGELPLAVRGSLRRLVNRLLQATKDDPLPSSCYFIPMNKGKRGVRPLFRPDSCAVSLI